MNLEQLNAELNRLNVTPPDLRRAAIYLRYLQAAKEFFESGLRTDLNENYNLVKQALEAKNLLDELAEILDLYTAPAIQREIEAVHKTPPYTYIQYFENVILGDNYQTNISNFFHRDNIVLHALEQLSSNFIHNIQLLCKRVIKDIGIIESSFNEGQEEDSHFNIVNLVKIKSSGSDFHKGGKQVLILTFSISYLSKSTPPNSHLTVVYKPSDIEADCLLTGVSGVANRNISKFFVGDSLVEIFNKLIQQRKEKGLSANLEVLPTYCILPMVSSTMDFSTGKQPENFREAYGYLEYLEHDEYDGITIFGYHPFSCLGYYPFGYSDYVIFPSQAESSISEKFYRQMGEWLAIAATFSITDMHLQNIIVKKYIPYLIDLEVSLTDPITDITGTAFFLNKEGGIDGFEKQNEHFHWIVKRVMAGNSGIVREYLLEKHKNRLILKQNAETLVEPAKYSQFILEGFRNGMETIRYGELMNVFRVWFERIKNVLVRCLPYETKRLKDIINNIFFDRPDGRTVELLPYVEAIRRRLDQQFEVEREQYQPGISPEPAFAIFRVNTVREDYENLDIPAFYHRIGTLDLLDSKGVQIPMQDFIRRPTYFAEPPTPRIFQDQLAILKDDKQYEERVKIIEDSIKRELGISDTPAPSQLVPQQ